MVEYRLELDQVFMSLADATRRDILARVLQLPQSIQELALAYSMSFAAVAKHISILESAGLVQKTKQGRKRIISANPETIAAATRELQRFEALWNDRFDRLDQLLADA